MQPDYHPRLRVVLPVSQRARKKDRERIPVPMMILLGY